MSDKKKEDSKAVANGDKDGLEGKDAFAKASESLEKKVKKEEKQVSKK